MLFRIASFALLALLVAPASAQQVTVRTPALDLQTDRAFELPLEVGSVASLGITSYQFTLRYDADLFEIEAVETDGTLSDRLTTTVNAPGLGSVSVAAAGASPLEGGGTLLRLRGRVTGDGLVGEAVTTPEVDDLVFFDAQGNVVASETEIRPLRVAGLRVSLPLETGGSGDPLALTVEVDDLTGRDITAYQFTLRYDPAILRVDGVGTAGTLSVRGAPVVNAATQGRLIVAYAVASPMVGAGPLLRIQGQWLASGDPALEFGEFRMFDSVGEEVAITPPEFQVREPVVGGAVGPTTSVPVRTGSLTGLGVTAYQFALQYNPAVVEVTGIDVDGTISAGLSPIVNTQTPGEVAVALAVSTPLTGGGDLVRLRVRRLTTGDPGFVFTSFRLFPSDVASVPLTISPQRGGDIGSVTATITGLPFADGASVRLVRGGTVIEGEVVSGDAAALRATFNLFGQPRGDYDLEVTSGGVTGRLQGAFEVVEGEESGFWADVVGRDVIRVGRPSDFTIMYGNRGANDLYFVPLTVSIPSDINFNINTEIFDFNADGQYEEYESNVSDTLLVDGVNHITLIVPFVPSGAVGYFDLVLTADEGGESLVSVHYSVPLLEYQEDGGLSAKLNIGGGFSIVDCALNAVGGGLSLSGIRLGNTCARAIGFVAGSIGVDIVNEIRRDGDLGVIGAGSYLNTTVGGAVSIAGCFFQNLPVVRGLSLAVGVIGAGIGLVGAYETCGISDAFERLVEAVGSIDPNEKVGSAGAGEQRFLSGEEPLRYAIYFENLPAATAAAQEVFVTDTLDASTLDLSTFSFGPISWGTEGRVEPPPGLQRYSTRYDLRPDLNLLLGIDATLNRANGVVQWTFRSLDPDTGVLTDDPFLGFLPPNANPPEGEGKVLFTVDPKPTLTTGTPIRNTARIVFDLNEPIDTNTWLNTIDNTPPSSQVEPFSDSPTPVDSVLVTWSGSDVGAGVFNYSVYVSENGNPFEPWLTNTRETSAYYTTETPGTLGFYSVARDGTGNVEDAPDVADAIVEIVVPGEEGPPATVPFQLRPIAPNPFGSLAHIRYGLAEAGPVRLEVFDVLGRRVARLVDEERAAGMHVFSWEPGALAGGVYVLRLVQGSRHAVRTVVHQR